MSIVYECTCGKRWKAPDSARNQKFECPNCFLELQPRESPSTEPNEPKAPLPRTVPDKATRPRWPVLAGVVAVILLAGAGAALTLGPTPTPVAQVVEGVAQPAATPSTPAARGVDSEPAPSAPKSPTSEARPRVEGEAPLPSQQAPAQPAASGDSVELPRTPEKGAEKPAESKSTPEPTKPTSESPAEPPAAEKPAVEKPAAEKPAAEKPAVETPGAEKPATEKPSEPAPTSEKPSAEKPATPAAPAAIPSPRADEPLYHPHVVEPQPPTQVEITRPVRSKFLTAQRSPASLVRLRAVKDLREYPCAETVDLLYKPAIQDPADEVRKAACETLAEFRNDKRLGVHLLERLQADLQKNPKLVEQFGTLYLVRVVPTFFYAETILPLVDWFEHAQPEVAFAAADGVLSAVRDKAGIRRIEALPLIARLAETKYFEGHYGFRRTMVESVMQMQAKDGLPLLIQWLPRLDGQLRQRTIAYLDEVALTAPGDKGKPDNPIGDDPPAWAKWWRDNEKHFELNKAVAAELAPARANVSYYGVQARTNRVIFILDTSKSMLDGTSVLNKLVDAKQALIATLEKLPADVSFNVVTFNTSVSSWKPTAMPATEANKKSAIEHVRNLVAAGRTNSYEALLTAFRMDRNVETIFFVSDGAPSAGTIIDPAAILEAVHSINRVQRAAIHTVGVFGGVPEPGVFEVFMKRLAEENEGKYVRQE